jgi:hypothetical protein
MRAAWLTHAVFFLYLMTLKYWVNRHIELFGSSSRYGIDLLLFYIQYCAVQGAFWTLACCCRSFQPKVGSTITRYPWFYYFQCKSDLTSTAMWRSHKDTAFSCEFYFHCERSWGASHKNGTWLDPGCLLAVPSDETFTSRNQISIEKCVGNSRKIVPLKKVCWDVPDVRYRSCGYAQREGKTLKS